MIKVSKILMRVAHPATPPPAHPHPKHNPPAHVHKHKPEMSPLQWYKKLNLKELEKANNLYPGVLLHIIEKESRGDSKAVSYAGAKGLFQIMPPGISGFHGNPFNPQQSAAWAAKNIGVYAKHFKGDYAKVMASYNWGYTNVINHGVKHLPDQTQKYVQYFVEKGVINPHRG